MKTMRMRILFAVGALCCMLGFGSVRCVRRVPNSFYYMGTFKCTHFQHAAAVAASPCISYASHIICGCTVRIPSSFIALVCDRTAVCSYQCFVMWDDFIFIKRTNDCHFCCCCFVSFLFQWYMAEAIDIKLPQRTLNIFAHSIAIRYGFVDGKCTVRTLHTHSHMHSDCEQKAKFSVLARTHHHGLCI